MKPLEGVVLCVAVGVALSSLAEFSPSLAWAGVIALFALGLRTGRRRADDRARLDALAAEGLRLGRELTAEEKASAVVEVDARREVADTTAAVVLLVLLAVAAVGWWYFAGRGL